MKQEKKKRIKKVATKLTKERLSHFARSTSKRGRTAFMDEVRLLLRFFRSWVQGSYTKKPWRMFLAVLFGLLYFISPIDLIIDFIPFIGYLDDMTVIALIVKFFSKDIRKFKEWEQKQEMESLRKKVRETEGLAGEK